MTTGRPDLPPAGPNQASLQRGVAYLQRKQWQQAQAALRQALDEAPASIPAHYWMGFCQANLGKHLQALRHLEDALQLRPLDDAWRVKILRMLARVAIQAGDYGLAASSLDTAFQITGGSGAPILNQLARVFCKSGEFERGFDLFFRAMNQGR